MKKILAATLIIVLCLMAGGSITAVTLLSLNSGVTATEISFSVSQIDMVVGDECDIPLVKSKDGDVTIISSNSGIVKIEDGKMQAVDTLGNNRSLVYLTATNEVGDKAYLNVVVYSDVDNFLAYQGSGLYVAYRVYNSASDSWRLAGFKRYEKDAYVDQPIVPSKEGFDIGTDWYSTENMLEGEKITFQGITITKSFAIYTEEYIRDGSAKVSGHIDLNVAYDEYNSVYVVTGLKYGHLKYQQLIIPKTYQIEEDGETKTVEIKGIADEAFYRAKKGEGDTRLNTGLQALKKVDISHIEYVGNYAFKDCLVLDTIIFNQNATPIIADTAFEGTAFIA